MHCCLTSLQEKQVINVKNGACLGTVGDIEVDSCTGKVIAIVVFSKGKYCGLGKSTKIKILWEQIEVIGDETILVQYDAPCFCDSAPKVEKKSPIEGLFR